MWKTVTGEAIHGMNKPVAIWITGLPGSGKSTIADALKERRAGFVVLRMDDLRRIVTPEPSYSEQERDIVYRSIIYLAKNLVGLGHSVIIDATGNLRRWRALARQLIPGYVEVYLKCDLEECRKRERERVDTKGAPKEIYRKGGRGWPVPGLNAPYEEPENPEVMIDTSATDIGETVGTIESFLKGRDSEIGP